MDEVVDGARHSSNTTHLLDPLDAINHGPAEPILNAMPPRKSRRTASQVFARVTRSQSVIPTNLEAHSQT